MKKLVSLLLAAAMCGAMAFTAFAEENVTDVPDDEYVPQEPIITYYDPPVLPEAEFDIYAYFESRLAEMEEENSPTEPGNGLVEFHIPRGNGTLIDQSFAIDYMKAISVQFLTVQSRGGNTFYIIIEHGEDYQNVYFLNAVDDWDLLAFSEDFPEDYLEVIAASRQLNHERYLEALENLDEDTEGEEDLNADSPIFRDKTVEEETNEEPQKSGGNNQMLMVGVILIVVVGGIIMMIKKKKSGGGKQPKNNYVEEDDEDD